MAGVNKVIIVGRLGNNPEMRQMPNGDAVANISVATSEVWNDKNTGERREVTEWHRIVLFRRNAEIAGQYLRKGSQVYIEGKIKTRKWQDQNGQERYTTEIQADSLTMLGDRPNNGQSPQNQRSNQPWDGYTDQERASVQQHQRTAARPAPQSAPVANDFDDDIPFAPHGHGLSRVVTYVI